MYNRYMAIRKRKYFNGKDYNLDLENQVVRIAPEFYEKLINKQLPYGKGFKKIGGSSIGDVLLVDQWKSQFVAFCRIAWIGLPILDTKYIDAGNAIEQKVLDAVAEMKGSPVKGYPAAKYNYDYFAGKDDVVGGLPDGLLEKEGIVLEVKTTGEKNYDKWAQWGVPAGYIKQASLYTYLMGLEKYSIVATFLKEEDYAHPEDYPIRQRRIKSYNFTIVKSQVEDDIKKVKEWYYKVTKEGVSPKFDPVKDKDQIEYLKCSNEEEWQALLSKWRTMGKIPSE